jgi:hypothetical protein
MGQVNTRANTIQLQAKVEGIAKPDETIAGTITLTYADGFPGGDNKIKKIELPQSPFPFLIQDTIVLVSLTVVQVSVIED